jgi:hypothetical protein
MVQAFDVPGEMSNITFSQSKQGRMVMYIHNYNALRYYEDLNGNPSMKLTCLGEIKLPKHDGNFVLRALAKGRALMLGAGGVREVGREDFAIRSLTTEEQKSIFRLSQAGKSHRQMTQHLKSTAERLSHPVYQTAYEMASDRNRDIDKRYQELCEWRDRNEAQKKSALDQKRGAFTAMNAEEPVRQSLKIPQETLSHSITDSSQSKKSLATFVVNALKTVSSVGA